MPYEHFIERFPQLGWKETRSATVFANNSYGLPADEYGLIEMYCNDENCDCRRVFFDVVSRKREETIAVVTYGWEPASYYQRWFGGSDEEISRMAVDEMAGLGLNSASHQSKIAPAALELVRDLLKDKNYMERIKRHYKMFKETVDNQPMRSPDPDDNPAIPESTNLPSKDVPVQKSRKRHRSRRSGA